MKLNSTLPFLIAVNNDLSVCLCSKTGRPLKKLWDRRGFSRRGHMPNNGSPDITGIILNDQSNMFLHICCGSYFLNIFSILLNVY